MKNHRFNSKSIWLLIAGLIFFAASFKNGQKPEEAETIALWLFDEPTGLYPSHVMDDASPNDYPLTLGLNGKIVKGKFGNALSYTTGRKLDIPPGEVRFGLKKLPPKKGRKTAPLSWYNAEFCALMTTGEKHLRQEVGHVNATDVDLNLGGFDWTVEFWYATPAGNHEKEVIFEIGRGPRGENSHVTSLTIDHENGGFEFINQPSKTDIVINSSLKEGWHHYAFIYDSGDRKLYHYVDGKRVSMNEKVKIKLLAHGDEAYMAVGTDGLWQNPIQGKLDELRFSKGIVYSDEFEAPGTFASKHAPYRLVKGLPLLFDKEQPEGMPLLLGSRKHLFIDDAIIEKNGGAMFVVNPPKVTGRVIDSITGEFRKHLTVVEDEEGIIRIYNSGPKDYLQVFVSRDGIHFEAPDTGHGEIEGQKNIVIPMNVGGLGNPFIDPNGPDSERWKYISGYHRRGIYVFTSPDGYDWQRVTTALVPFRSGTQSCSFYDDQRQMYVGYHRSGIFHTPAGATQRSSVVTETKDLFSPVEYKSLTQEEYYSIKERLPLRHPLPWYLDNGPLTPGGFGMEFPHKFDPIPEDPVGLDLYVTKAQKYEWAPDAYLAFPIVYFHYEEDGPITRQILQDPRRKRGSGPLETQIEVSRNGLTWHRYTRPAYVGIGNYFGRDVHTIYMANGMVRRGNEIWQYFFGETQYHSAWTRDKLGRGVYRTVQRLDGFISLDSPYDREIEVVTKPFVFKGDRLVLNINTDAAGYAQVGFLDKNKKPIEGFTVDQCVYINGNFI